MFRDSPILPNGRRVNLFFSILPMQILKTQGIIFVGREQDQKGEFVMFRFAPFMAIAGGMFLLMVGAYLFAA